MYTCPTVSVSSPATQCISVDLPEPGRAHDRRERARLEVDGHPVEGPNLRVALAVDLRGIDGRAAAPTSGSGGGLGASVSGHRTLTSARP